MDKKPLIVCAVFLLVLGSLSNVVGYQTVKSNTLNDSPLFVTRTQRATNQQQNILTSKYLGMERGNLLQFPFRDNQTEQLKKAIDIISKMDDKAFERFSEMCIKKMRQEENFKKDANPNEITEILKLLRKNPEIITQSFSNLNNQNIKSSDGATISNSVIVCLLIGGISSLLVWIYFFLAMVLIFFLAIIGFPTFQAIPDCLPD